MKKVFLQVVALEVIVLASSCAFCAIPDLRPASRELQSDWNHPVFLNISELGYSEEGCALVSNWILSWHVKPERPLVKYYSQVLRESKADYEAGRLSETRWCRSQEKIVAKIAKFIHSRVAYNEQWYDLTDVAIKKQGQCLGLTQLYYVVGKAIGLEIVPILVLPDYETVAREHVACLVQLNEDKYMMVDMASDSRASLPFTFHKHYALDETGNMFTGQEDRLGLHCKIQPLDQNGLLALVYNSRAKDLAARHQDEQAISVYSDAIKTNPSYSTAWANRAIIYLRQGDVNNASYDIDRAIELNPGMAEAYNTQGLVYSKQRNYQSAIKAFDLAIELNPSFVKAYNNRGVNYWKLGQHEQSLKDYADAVRLKPDYVSAYVNRATVYGHLERYEEAVRDCSRAIQYAPSCYQAYHSRGIWYTKLDRTDNAQDDLLYAKALRGPLK